MAIPRLVGERVTLRPIEEADRGPLRAILAETGVARWWGTAPDEAVADLYEPYQISFVIEVDGALVGSLQVAEEDTADYRRAASTSSSLRSTRGAAWALGRSVWPRGTCSRCGGTID